MEEEHFTREAKKDGKLQLMQQESLMKEWVVKVESTRQEEFLWQSTASWEQLLEQKEEGRGAQAWANVRGGLRVFSVYFRHSESWTPRNEALLEALVRQAKVTRHLWLVACDASMCPENLKKSLWFQRERMHVVASKEVSTCRSKGAEGERIERTHDYVIACKEEQFHR